HEAKTLAGDLVTHPATHTPADLAAPLVAPILWNLLTWYYGIPSSSSHALIGGIIGAVWCHEVGQNLPAGESLRGLLTSHGVRLTLEALVLSPMFRFLGGVPLMGLLSLLVFRL